MKVNDELPSTELTADEDAFLREDPQASELYRNMLDRHLHRDNFDTSPIEFPEAPWRRT